MSISQSNGSPPVANPPANPITTASSTSAPDAQLPASSATATPATPGFSSQSPAFVHNNGNAGAFHYFSASTEEILKRISAKNAAATVGVAGLEAAREQVLQKMTTIDKLPTPPPIANSARRGGRGGGRVGTPSGLKSEVGGSPATTSTPGSGRGRGSARGRGRGGARGGKRKRADSDDSENDSDISSSYTPLPTKTKSGRNVNKPVVFVPTLPSPTGKKRKPNSKRAEAALCQNCKRGPSPNNNAIVFCDECNLAYHQLCHDPPIENDVIQIYEKEWICGPCTRSKAESAVQGTQDLVAGSDLSIEEKKAYLSTLSPPTLISLILRSTEIHPSLPIFAPNASQVIAASKNAPAQPLNVSKPPSHVPTQAKPTQTTTSAPFHPNPTNNGIDASPSTGTPRSQHIPTDTSDIDPAEAQLQSEIRSYQPYVPAHAATDKFSAPIVSTSLAPPAPDPQPPVEEEYDGYDTDPPAHYPKAGNGLARTLRPESEDLHWLVDDNFEVFSHSWKGDGTGLGADGTLNGV